MKVLLTGATGLIGGEIAGRLVGLGHEVVAVSRRREGRRLLGTQTVCLDFRGAVLADWLGHLADIDAVVNCVGVLQGNFTDSPEAAHAHGPAVLFEACEAAGVRRVIHFSAVGVDRGARSSFSASKAAGDADLQARDLDWVILRPSVVLGRPVYGASALFRGLATLPLLPRAQDAGLLQVVQLEDVVETVVRLLAEPKLKRETLELVGPEQLSFDEVVAHYRHWYGWAPARLFSMPAMLFRLLYRLGDLVAWLGWRPPVRSNARREIERGAVGDPEPWQRATGIAPQRLGDALAASPPSVQDRWFARMFLLKPVVFATFSVILDRHGADFARARLGTRRRAHAGRRCRRLVCTGRRRRCHCRHRDRRRRGDPRLRSAGALSPRSPCRCFMRWPARSCCRRSGATHLARCSRSPRSSP